MLELHDTSSFTVSSLALVRCAPPTCPPLEPHELRWRLALPPVDLRSSSSLASCSATKAATTCSSSTGSTYTSSLLGKCGSDTPRSEGATYLGEGDRAGLASRWVELASSLASSLGSGLRSVAPPCSEGGVRTQARRVQRHREQRPAGLGRWWPRRDCWRCP